MYCVIQNETLCACIYLTQYICTLVLPNVNDGILIKGNHVKPTLMIFVSCRSGPPEHFYLMSIYLESLKEHKVLNVFDSLILKFGKFMYYKHQTKLLSQTVSNYFIRHNQISILQARPKITFFRYIYSNNQANFTEIIQYGTI